MKIPCSNCQHEIQLDDSRVPEGMFKLKCPKCGKLITAQRPAASAIQQAAAADNEANGIPHELQAYVKQEIAAAKSEMMNLFQAFFRGDSRVQDFLSGGELASGSIDKKALICHSDVSSLEKITAVVKSIGYEPDISSISTDTMKKLEMASYPLVVVNHSLADDKEAGRKIVGRLNSQKPVHRRQTFIVLISPHVKSGDSNQAFFYGVNITVAEADLPNLESLIRDGQRYFQQLYSTYIRVREKSEERIG